jgi:pimeloyl-ACP methyl ester carboxylesterase
VDHADPGQSVALDVVRRPALDQAGRLGTIIVNPGGPGGSGTSFVRAGVPLPPAVLDVFDVVGWDPRGTGSTSPQCDESLPAFYALDSAPDSAAGQAELEAGAEQVAADCDAAAGASLAELSTTATVHDLELLRQSIGEQLNFVGFSYGTRIGLLYSDTYGSELRSMAAVGVVDPELDFEALLAGQTAAVDPATDRMLSSCADQRACHLEDPLAAYDQLASRIAVGKFAGSGLGPAQLVDATLGAVYDEASWPGYLSALETALAGDPGPMLEQTARYFGSGDLYLPYTAISCLQEQSPEGTDYRGFAAELDALSPRFGAAIANELLPCAFWPVPAVDPSTAVEAMDAPTILLVASEGDAITPISWTEAVMSGLTDTALVLRKGDGHRGTTSSPCVAAALTDYLLEPESITGTIHCED